MVTTPPPKRLRLGDLTISSTMQIFTISPNPNLSFSIRTNLDCMGVEMMIRKWLNKTLSLSQASFINFINLYSNYQFKAKRPKNELSDGHIRHIEGISNSYLTQVLHQLKGTKPTYPARCLVFGAALHEYLLEPQHFILEQYNLRKSEQQTLENMRQQWEQHPFFKSYFKTAQKEVVKTWTDAQTGLRCKGKIDLVLENGEIADLKTTAAYSYKQFIKSLSQYDIDRQAAFYMRGCKTRRFWVIGLQKRPPYQVFIKAFYCNSKFIRTGRKKANFLLQKLSVV